MAKMTGHPKAAVFLSQLIHWTRHGTKIQDTNGWVYKTYREWWQETGMSRTELDNARQRLRTIGLIEEIRAGRPATLWYRINLARFSQALEVCRDRALPTNLTFEFMQTEERLVRDFLGPTTAFHRILAEMTGSIHSGLLLSRLLQLQKRALDTRKEWLTFTADMWRDDLALNRRALENARRRLCDLELIDELRIHQGTPRILTQIRPRPILHRLTELIAKDSAEVRAARAAIAGVRKPSPPRLENAATDIRAGRAPHGNRLSTGEHTNSLVNQGLVDPDVRNKQSRNANTSFLDCRESTYEFVENVPSSLQVLSGSLYRSTNTPPLTPSLNQQPPTHAQTRKPKLPTGNRDVVVGSEVDFEAKALSGLQWPQLPAALRESAEILISPITNSADAQNLIDEWSARMRHAGLRNPLGYLRHLVGLAQLGTFIPELAYQEAHRRQMAAAVHTSVAAAASAVAPERGPVTTTDADRVRARAALAQARQILQGSRA
ncbi:hypothetical protein [Achromobacter aloeverae]